MCWPACIRLRALYPKWHVPVHTENDIMLLTDISISELYLQAMMLFNVALTMGSFHVLVSRNGKKKCFYKNKAYFC